MGIKTTLREVAMIEPARKAVGTCDRAAWFCEHSSTLLGAVERYLRKKGCSEHVVEEAAQEAMFQTQKGIVTRKIEEVADWDGWVFSVALYCSRHPTRAKQLPRDYSVNIDEVIDVAETERTEGQMLTEAIEIAIERLPKKDRILCRMRLLEGVTQEKIGHVLRLSAGHVSRLLKTAMQRLGVELQKEGFGPEENL